MSATETRLEHARNDPNKKVVKDGATCMRCGETGHIVIYYDHLAPDRKCIHCGCTH